MLGSQRLLVPVAFVVSPCAAWKRDEFAAFRDQALEVSVGLERREKIAPPPRTSSQHHSLAFFRTDGSLIDHLREYRVRMVRQIFESRYSVLIKSGQHDNQAATKPQFAGTQREESFPIFCSLALESGALGAGSADRNEMPGTRAGISLSQTAAYEDHPRCTDMPLSPLDALSLRASS